MQAVKRFFEAYLGVPPAGPGQGTEWRVEARPPGPEGWPEGLVITLAALLAIGVVALYFREARRLPAGRRLALAGLRLGALALVGAMLSQATLAVDRTGLPVVAVLVDTSGSMGLPEGGDARSKGTTRLDLSRRLLSKEKGAFLERLSRRFRVRLYRFDGGATPLATTGGEEPRVGELIAGLGELQADGEETRPATAVRQVLDDLRGAAPSAIVALTDGVSTGGESEALSSIAALAGQRRAPLYPVGVGSDGPARDLELAELVADEVAFLGDPVRVTARLRGYGLRNEPVRLTLSDRASGAILAETTAVIDADGGVAQADLSFTPEAEGEIELSVTARIDGTEGNRENNVATRLVSVRKQSVRVLLAERTPRYEFRFLKSLLEREPTIELDVVLQEADLGFSAEDRTALERFPLRKEEVLAYDVIVFGDLDPGLLGPDVLKSLEEFVRVKGGGLIGIAGPEFFPMRYAGTPLEPALPVEPGSVTAPLPDSVLGASFRLRRTLQGRQAGPMFRLGQSESESEAIWEELPGLYWRADASALRPGAVTLAEAQDISGRARPVIALQRFGAGKVLLHLTDETWRWRFRAGDRYFGRYWIQAIRYLSRSALLGHDRGAELTTDRREYSQGEAVSLRVRFLDERLAPTEGTAVSVLVEDRSGERRRLELTRRDGAPEEYEGSMERLAQGVYHAWIVEPSFTGAPPSADFRIRPPERELTRRGADLADLRRAAELSGGRYFDLNEAERLPSFLPAGRPARLEAATPTPLWNRPELLIALACVLTGEWLLRKRAKLA